MIVDFELIEYLDFVMGFITCGAFALYLIMTRKKKK